MERGLVWRLCSESRRSFLLATEVLRWDLTITTGLSAKNLVIYLVATFLALRMVVARSSIMAAGQMQGAFIVQIGYAIITMADRRRCSSSTRGMTSSQSGIKLKSGLIDYYIFFARVPVRRAQPPKTA